MNNFYKEYTVSTIIYRLEKYRNLGLIKKSQIAKQGIVLLEFPSCFIKELSKFPDLQYPGIYFLLNKNTNPQKIYVGKTANLYQRLSQHSSSNTKDFNYCLAFSMNGFGNAAVIDYLEYHYIAKLNSQNHYEVINSIPRTRPVFSEYDELEFDPYVKAIDNFLNYVGINLDATLETLNTLQEELPHPNNECELIQTSASSEQDIYSSDIFKFKDGKLIRKSENEYVLLTGSKILSKPRHRKFNESHPNYELNLKRHNEFVNRFNNFISKFQDSLKLTPDGEHYELIQDISFKSCSAPYELIYGRRGAESWFNWKNDAGLSLNDIYRKHKI